jgi:hypothetical protein
VNRKLSPDKLYEALDLISKGVIRPSQIATALDVSYRTYAGWMLRSNRNPDDPDFLVVIDGETMSFARAISIHKRLFYLELRGAVESYSLLGRESVLYKDAQVVWKIDAAAAAIDDPDIRELLGYRRDALVEINGELQPVTQHTDAPIKLIMRVLETGFADWVPGTTSKVAITGNVAVGIAHIAKPTYAGPPPVAIAEPAIPAIEDQSDRDVIEPDVLTIEDQSDGDFTDAEFEEVEAPKAPEPEPEPVVSETALPDRYGDLQRQLLARLEAGTRVV